MAKTLLEISTEVLQEIGRLPDGQVAPASQTDKIADAYTGLYEELLNNSIVDWSSTDDIPEYATNPIIIMLASRVAGRFGVPNQWLQREGLMRATLAQQIASPYVPQPTQFESF